MNYTVAVQKTFSSAHALRGYKGRCENLHGHNWRVTVTVTSKKLNALGMVMDFTDLKYFLSCAIEKLDHQFINKVAPFDTINPTAEHISAYIYRHVQAQLKSPKTAHLRIHAVTVWESDTSCATAS